MASKEDPDLGSKCCRIIRRYPERPVGRQCLPQARDPGRNNRGSSSEGFEGKKSQSLVARGHHDEIELMKMVAGI